MTVGTFSQLGLASPRRKILKKIFFENFQKTSKLSRNIFRASSDHVVAQKSIFWKKNLRKSHYLMYPPPFSYMRDIFSQGCNPFFHQIIFGRSKCLKGKGLPALLHFLCAQGNEQKLPNISSINKPFLFGILDYKTSNPLCVMDMKKYYCHLG